MQPTFRVRTKLPTAAAFLPPSDDDRDLHALRRAAARCQGCELYRAATQTVFGEGAAHAKVVIVGEQPGDQEDKAGHPFVGPAGALLDLALGDAGIDRRDVYVTNAVKHFKYTQRGKRRVHAKPSRTEVVACKPWLDAELAAIDPDVLLLLGATAAQALLGARFKVTEERGKVLHTPFARATIVTVHPASVLRAPDEDARRLARLAFMRDVAVAGAIVRRGARPAAGVPA